MFYRRTSKLNLVTVGNSCSNFLTPSRDGPGELKGSVCQLHMPVHERRTPRRRLTGRLVMVAPLPRPAALLLALLLGSCSGSAAAQPPPPPPLPPRQGFAVDLGAASGINLNLQPFDNAAVTRCFGSSHAATAMRADWQRELATVQKDLGVEYVRFHGLFDDDMSVVVPGHPRRKLPVGAHPAAAGSKLKPGPQKCTFVEGQDFRDAGANVVNASSKEECCALCYTESTGLPEPCVAAVFAAGRCYFKLGDEKPYMKPESGVVACVTDRPSAKSYQDSFSNIFTVFDFLRSIDMRPIVEVSFMPELLAAYTNKTVFHYKGILSPPSKFADWCDLMTAFGSAMIERYGEEEVAKWYFEVSGCTAGAARSQSPRV
eukprot:SAG22_NODE_1091_length_5589_cov_3.691439_1_plen_373_part_00